MSFNYGREEKKWRLWKEAEEKQLRSLGVSEDTIEQLHTPKRQVGGSNPLSDAERNTENTGIPEFSVFLLFWTC